MPLFTTFNYKLKQNFSDIDECLNIGCDEGSEAKHACSNSPEGTFTCTCDRGYEFKNGGCVGKCVQGWESLCCLHYENNLDYRVYIEKG